MWKKIFLNDDNEDTSKSKVHQVINAARLYYIKYWNSSDIPQLQKDITECILNRKLYLKLRTKIINDCIINKDIFPNLYHKLINFDPDFEYKHSHVIDELEKFAISINNIGNDIKRVNQLQVISYADI